VKLLTSSTKIAKNDIDGRYLSAILYMWPGGENICPFASKGCLASCLVTSGMGRFPKVVAARKARRKFFLTRTTAFLQQLSKEIEAHVKKAIKLRKIPLIRLNGTSDIDWDLMVDMVGHSPAIFYDYTKNPRKFQAYIEGRLPKNYYLVFSRSEDNELTSWDFCQDGHTTVWVVSEVVKQIKLASSSRYVDGDLNDLAFEHPKGSIILLKEKGRAKKDKTGFVVR
jgi:hypothetical protein